jgi:hypothetical protein
MYEKSDMPDLIDALNYASGSAEVPFAEEEISEEMISAGITAYEFAIELSDPLAFSDEIVSAVYRAMAAAKPLLGPPPTTTSPHF